MRFLFGSMEIGYIKEGTGHGGKEYILDMPKYKEIVL